MTPALPLLLLRPLRALALGVLIMAAGCNDGTGPAAGPIQFQLALQAFGRDSTAERWSEYSCSIYGSFQVARPLAANGTVTFPARVERLLVELRGNHIEHTRADTSIAEAELVYSGLGQNSLSFVLTAGPYTASLGPGGISSTSAGGYSGDWTCGADVPLAQDSTLLAYGYDAALLPPGRWEVFELQPFE